MSYIFTKGATSQAIELYIVDSTDGTPETGVVFNSAGIDLKYRRKDAVVVSITEIDLTTPLLTDTWESGGFLEIGNGVYRLDLPDAALASAAGIDRVVVFGTVTGMVVLPVTIHLTAFDLSTASTPQTADHTAGIADIPTVAEFEARTIVAANYVVVGDTIAGVTNAGTVTGNVNGSVGSVTGAVGSVTGAVGSVTGAVGSVGAGGITAASLGADCITNAKIADDAIAAENFATDAIATDAVAATAFDKIVMSDLAQGAPSATASLPVAINYLYESWRNKTTTTATLITVMKDDGSTGLVKSTISDDATTFTKSEMISGA